MADIFNVAFLENFKILIAAILIYALVFALLKKLAIFGDSGPVNSLIALMSAIVVSFTGVVSYAISYAINWFVIIVFVIFLIMILLMFVGIDFETIAGAAKNNSKVIFWVFLGLFAIIILKSFFAVNNTFDINNPPEDSYDVDTSFNTGMDDITNEDTGWFGNLFSSIDSDLVAIALFLGVLGIFVFIIGN